jgi:hypothetical protein
MKPLSDTFGPEAGPSATDPFVTIEHAENIAPFLINVVSAGSGWIFAGSNASLTAGRVSPARALFPYRNADQILGSRDGGGLYAAIACDDGVWEPYAGRAGEDVSRTLRKHVTGGSLVFEEEHLRLGLRFGWEIAFSERVGLLKRSWIENLRSVEVAPRVMEGWRHILPPGLPDGLYTGMSYLARAYMRHELAPGGAAIYSLNVGVSDRAEPCESLRYACAVSAGLEGFSPHVLPSERQLGAFLAGRPLREEHEARGCPGAHLVGFSPIIPAGGRVEWWSVLDTWLDHARLAERVAMAESGGMTSESLGSELAASLQALGGVLVAVDGWQVSGDPTLPAHHAANALFNAMRGGLPEEGIAIPPDDFAHYLSGRNRPALARARAGFPHILQARDLFALRKAGDACGDPDLARACREYLPLTFGRRHGDPSRPWNKFSIEIADSNGNPTRNYQGNWRDIFQNWEALAVSYPALLPSMVALFLNASTADGFNPYRIERKGVDWEVLDPEDPWSNIGYWGDHQIVYLTRLLEAHETAFPGELAHGLDGGPHVFVDVPYRIRPFAERLRDPRASIRFDQESHERHARMTDEIGGDGRLLRNADGEIVGATLAEKLLIPVLAKIGNLVPDGGVWLNTQRPEWNDANNALAGWGLSVVTTAQLYRHLDMLQSLFSADFRVHLSQSSSDLLGALRSLVADLLSEPADGPDRAGTRMRFMREAGEALDAYWRMAYGCGLGTSCEIACSEIREAIRDFRELLADTLRANRRPDGLFHSYNLLAVNDGGAAVHNLDLMLEGQVAVLASGFLSAEEAAQLLATLRTSELFREDQNSYTLYPDRKLPPVLGRNTLPADGIALFSMLADAGDHSLAIRGRSGCWHFAPDLRNPRELCRRLDELAADPRWISAVSRDGGAILAAWEQAFAHSRFTGRSGGMFAFEGLGSIYWHMVAKLLLAVGELATGCPDGSATARALALAYSQIRDGLGFRKSPGEFGAFPCDPYSHTPAHEGAQQPGMTGQVKEEILSRQIELGVCLEKGIYSFLPRLLSGSEFEGQGGELPVGGPAGRQTLTVPPRTVAFTVCGVPVFYTLGSSASITVQPSDGETARTSATPCLMLEESASLLRRDGSIGQILVEVPAASLLL